VMFYLLDFFTDVNSLIIFAAHGDLATFSVLLAILIGSSIANGLLAQINAAAKNHPKPWKRFMYNMCQVDYLFITWKCWKAPTEDSRDENYNELTKHKLINAFCEAAPSATLQVFVLVAAKSECLSSLSKIQIAASILLSAVSIAECVISWDTHSAIDDCHHCSLGNLVGSFVRHVFRISEIVMTFSIRALIAKTLGPVLFLVLTMDGSVFLYLWHKSASSKISFLPKLLYVVMFYHLSCCGSNFVFFCELEQMDFFNRWYYPVKATEMLWLGGIVLAAGAVGPLPDVIQGDFTNADTEDLFVLVAFIVSFVLTFSFAAHIGATLSGKRGVNYFSYVTTVAPACFRYKQELNAWESQYYPDEFE